MAEHTLKILRCEQVFWLTHSSPVLRFLEKDSDGSFLWIEFNFLKAVELLRGDRYFYPPLPRSSFYLLGQRRKGDIGATWRF